MNSIPVTTPPKDEPLASAKFVALLAIVRRQSTVCVVVLLASLAIGALYLLTAVPYYSSTAAMVIDSRRIQPFQQQGSYGDTIVDSAGVETQVEILKSENISLSVVRDLRLASDPEFVGGPGLIGSILGTVFPRTPSSEFQLTRRALGYLERNRSVRRVGQTYVLELGFTSQSPDKAAQVANAIADAYVVDQLEAKYQATKRASLWLQDRIKELRDQATTAQNAVVEFKQVNNIVDTGGRLMNEQQLAEINSQLILARAGTSEAKARLDRIDDIIKQEVPDASVADALKNDTIVKLRGQYVDIAARESVWSAKYGHDHLAAVNLRTQMAEIKKNMLGELKRIQQSYKSDYEIALTREESIKSSLANTVAETQSTGKAQVQLRELESKAQSYQAMYDNLLQRYMESVQQQSFPISESRVISAATPPSSKSSPKAVIVLFASIVAGLLLGALAALQRELGDRVFRTGAQIVDLLHTPCIAAVPTLRHSKSLPSSGSDTPAVGLNYVREKPLSRFAEAIRNLKVTVDLAQPGSPARVIAITSSLPNEGKSTIAANLGQLIAQSGAKVLIVDADLRNPSLSRQLLGHSGPGLIELVRRESSLDDVLMVVPGSSLQFIAAGTIGTQTHAIELLSSPTVRETFELLKKQFDYLILDLPPLGLVSADVRLTSGLVDAYLYVVEWGQTKIDVAKHSLNSAPEVYKRLLGVVLNKVDERLISRYEPYNSSSRYYRTYYSRYGYTE